jgi:hypothetical protein
MGDRANCESTCEEISHDGSDVGRIVRLFSLASGIVTTASSATLDVFRFLAGSSGISREVGVLVIGP